MNEFIPPASVVLVDPKIGDFQAGAETAISSTPINPTGDWRGKEPGGEWQKLMGIIVNGGSGFETDACVTFSALDDLETYGDFCIANNLWPAESVQWLRDNGYFGADGKLNFSDRAIAKLSNTTTNGNSLPNVAQTIRTVGLVPEALWPMPIAEIQANPAQSWAIYYADVPQAVLDLGKEFLKRFVTLYDWVCWPANPATPAKLKELLKVAPIQIATAVCPPWNTDQVIKACGPGTAHGTMLSNVGDTQFDILDHYVPFDKHFALDYDITYGMRHVMQPVPAPVATPFQYTYSKYLKFQGAANDATELHAMQQGLQTVKDSTGKPYMRPGVFGPFGPQTKDALGRFQTDHKIKDPDGQGTNFGPASRQALNTALLANH